jgi:hypothetical protein
MSQNIRSFQIGTIFYQSGNGMPIHIATRGCVYIDVDTGNMYINKDGLVNWVPFSDSSSSIFGNYLPLSGGTVYGNTIFTSGLTVNYLDFDTTPIVPSPTGGTLYFDSTENALSYKPVTNQNDVTVNLGQESLIKIYNNLGYQINNGQVLHITGSTITGGTPTVALANASKLGTVFTEGVAQSSGVATHDIPSGQFGFMTNFGVVRDLNTSAFTAGDEVFLSDTIDGALTNDPNDIAYTSRVSTVGYCLESNATTGKILVQITNENAVQSLTQKEVNVLLGNTISTGVFNFTGITLASSNTFNVAPVDAWLVDNTTNPLVPEVLYVKYSGQTNIPSLYYNTATETYLLLTSAGTITQQTTFPTPQQRRQNIYLGKMGHGNRTSLINAFNEPDLDVSPLSQLRDMFTPIKLINENVYPSPNSNLTFNTSSGTLFGLGIGFTTNQLNPSSISVSGNSPTTFQYRTQTGGTATNRTTIDPANYDLNGVVTSIGSPAKQATNQRIYLLQNGQFRIQYGQTKYADLTTAIAAVNTEAFTTFSNFRDNAVLIAILSVRSDATILSNIAQAKITFASKFGETVGGTGGISTTTLQQAYDNSATPEIVTNSAEGALSIKNGTGNADNVTNLLEGINAAGNTTSVIKADGYISGTTIQTNGLTATTISATTYENLPISINTSGTTLYSTNPSTSNFSNNNSVYLGLNAGRGATGATYSNFLGLNSGSGATSASYSNFFGADSGFGATGANTSNFLGFEAGYGATGASSSNFLGNRTGKGATTASQSNFLGLNAGSGATNAFGSNFLGTNAGSGAMQANNSIFIGTSAGRGATGANNSIFLGYQAGYNLAGGLSYNNIIIGNNVSLNAGIINRINIGGVLFGSGTYSATSGNASVSAQTEGRIGINVVSPTHSLHVIGDTRLQGGLTASTISSTTITTPSIITSSTGLTINGNSIITGTTFLGNGTFTKAGYATGDILLDNSANDTPGLLMYYANNSNYGIDSWNGSFDVLSGQLVRITNKLNETGGAVKVAVDTSGNMVVTGFIKPNAWRAGQVINDIILSNTEVTISTTTVATSTSDTDFLTYSYTPLSSNSYLVIHYHLSDYTFESGTGNDSYFSRIKVDGAEITYSNQSTVNGFRSGVLFPLTGRYTNSNTTAKSIVVACRRDSADDSITIANTATSMWLRITEIGR